VVAPVADLDGLNEESGQYHYAWCEHREWHCDAWLVVAMMVIILVEVAARYVFNSPLGVADILTTLALIAIVYIGLAYACRKNRISASLS